MIKPILPPYKDERLGELDKLSIDAREGATRLIIGHDAPVVAI